MKLGVWIKCFLNFARVRDTSGFAESLVSRGEKKHHEIWTWVSFCNEWAKWNTTANINIRAAPNGGGSEIEYKKTAGGRVPNAAMVHRDTFITPTLPLASWESVCEIAPGLHVRMLRFCAYLSQYIISLFILRMIPFCAYLSQHIIYLFCACDQPFSLNQCHSHSLVHR